MKKISLQENTIVTQKDFLGTTTFNLIDPTIDLEKFLDDNFLKSEIPEEISAKSKGCTDRRGSTGSAWRK